MTTILKLIVYDRPGVLDRIAGLIRRNGWNINSINAGRYKKGITQINIVLDDERIDTKKLGSQLFEFGFLQGFKEYNNINSHIRELALISMKKSDYNAADFREAKIIEQNDDELVLEITGTPWEIDELLLTVQDKLLDCVRSGALGISKERGEAL